MIKILFGTVYILSALLLTHAFLKKCFIESDRFLHAAIIFLFTLLAPVGWAGLLLAEFGKFSVKNLLYTGCGILAISLFLFLRTVGVRRQKAITGQLSPGTVVFLIIAFLLCSCIYFYPSEHIYGGWDPGVYINTGANIASSGSINFKHEIFELINRLPKYFRHDRQYLKQIYPGFRISENGLILPQFYHLYPTYLAISCSLFGASGVLYTNPVFGLLTVFVFFLLARRLIGNAGAMFATLLFALNPGQIWQVRFQTAEIVAQFYAICGLYFFVDMKDRDNALWPVLGGLCLGMACLTRYDIILIVCPVAIVCCYLFLQHREMRISVTLFQVSLALLILHAYLHNRYVAYAYHPKLESVKPFVLGLSGLLACGYALALPPCKSFRKRLARLELSIGRRRKAIALISVLGFAYFFCMYMPLSVGGSEGGNFLKMSWFFSPAGIFLYILGIYMAVAKGKWHVLIFVTITLPASVFLFYNKFIDNFFMWAVRRYIMIVFPSIAILIAYAINKICDGNSTGWRTRRVRPILVSLLVMSVFIPITIRSIRIIPKADYKGLLRFCDTVAGRFDEDSIVICQGSFLAVPLRFIFQKKYVLQYSDNSPEKCAAIKEIMFRFLRKGEKITYISTTDFFFDGRLFLEKIASQRLQTERLEQKKNSLPYRMEKIGEEFSIYRIKETGTYRGKYLINLDRNWFAVASGFREEYTVRIPDRNKLTWRWTDGHGRIEVDANGLTSVNIRMKSWRPDDAAVEIVFGRARKSYTIPGEMDFRSYTLRISEPPRNGRGTIEIISDTFRAPGDLRPLGVMVDSITLRYANGDEETIDIGTVDTPITLSGFHEPEGLSYVWGRGLVCNRSGAITIPWDMPGENIHLAFNGMWLDEKSEGSEIDLLISGQHIGQIRLKNYPGWATIQINKNAFPQIDGLYNDLELTAQSRFFLGRVQIELR